MTQASIRSYRSSRQFIETGDLVFFDGPDILGRAVRLVTGPPTHVGLAAWAYDRLYIMEMWFRAEQNLFSWRIDYTRAAVSVYTVLCPPEIRKKAVYILSGWLGQPYDYLGLVGFGLSLLLHREVNLSRNPERLFCSEAVDMAYGIAGIQLTDKPPHLVSTHDLASSLRVMKKFDIKGRG